MLREEGVWPAARLNHLPPFTPVSRVANMRFVQTHGSAHASGVRASAACLARLAPVTGAALLLLSVYPDFTHPSPCRPSLQTVSRPSTLLRRLCQSRRVSVPAGDPRLTYTDFPPFRLQAPVRHRGAAFLTCFSAPDSTAPLLFTRGYWEPWGGSGLRNSPACSPA